MDSNWPRWIKASVNRAFDQDIRVASGLPLFIEGTDRRTEDLQTYAELRIDGPTITELSKGYWQFEITIDVLVNSKRNDEDIYTLERAVGNVLAAFKHSISVFKFGDGLNDNPTELLDCLILLPRAKDSIIVTNFGQTDIAVRLFQTTVEASYRMNLTT
jgi:hypothetical protein